jgi:hypothetical protein
MKQTQKLFAALIGLFFLMGPLLAENKPVDPAAKAEAEYQKFVKEHVGWKLLISEYDKFKKTTTFQSDARMTNELEFQKPGGGGLNIDLTVFAVFPDKITEKDPGAVTLMLIARGKSDESWRYIDCKEFNWLVDDASIEWDSLDYDNHVFDDASTSEYFNITVSFAKFALLAKAKKIEAKICNDEFIFTKKQLWVMRWVNEQVQAALAAKTAK